MSTEKTSTAAARDEHERLPRPPDAPRGFAKIGTAEIFAPLPPTQWACEPLGWCPGRPTMIAGYGYSGKTLAAQCAALQLAAGRSIWGTGRGDGFAIAAPSRVLHLDYEQGRTATLRRYQRLAVGLGVGVEDLDGRLDVVSLASVKLNDRDAFDVFARECAGYGVVFLDAFRGAVPGVDENESKVRDFLDVLTRVSDATGSTFVVIHHAGKSKQEDGRMVLRGSSAIFDACGSVLTLAGSEERGAPKEARQVKHSAEADRGPIEPFGLLILGEPSRPGAPAWVRVEYRTAEQVAAATAPPEPKRTTANAPKGAASVLERVRQNGGAL